MYEWKTKMGVLQGIIINGHVTVSVSANVMWVLIRLQTATE